MNKTVILVWSLLLCFLLKAEEVPYNHVFFDHAYITGPWFYSEADYSGPSYIEAPRKRLPVTGEVFFTPQNSIVLKYISATNGEWNAKILYPDWRGKDFIKESTTLDMRVLIESETGPSELPLIAIATRDGKSMSGYVALGDYIKTTGNGEWKHISIPLDVFKGIEYDHTQEVKQVLFKQNGNDGKTHTLFIDQIEMCPAFSMSSNPTAPAIQAKAWERHVDITWDKNHPNLNNARYIQIYRSENNGDFKPVGIQAPERGRFTDYTGEPGKTFTYRIACLDDRYAASGPSNQVSATTYEMNDEQLLDMIQEAHFRYYWDGAEPVSGLALENIPGRRDMIATGASGFGIMAIITGIERGFITREEGVQRFLTITSFLERADKFHGAVSHFINGPTGKAEPFFGYKDNGADLVETSFLFHGLLAARQYFNNNSKDEKAIQNSIDKLWKNVEWSWFKRYKNNPFLFWHWSPDQEWVINHQLIGWNETMITYLLAIMAPKYNVEPEMYYTGWASQDPVAQEYRADWGGTLEGSMYTNGTTYYGEHLDVGVSNGGPLFFIHYSYLGLNPHQFTDRYTNYFENNQKMAKINLKYCIENPGNYPGYGEDCWGMSASDFGWRYQAAEPILSRDNGTVPPTGALASFPYTPVESMKALKNYYRNHGDIIWGEYGFRDAFNLTENWCSPIFMGLNQGPITVMIENHRSGLIWDLFMSHPDVKKGLEKLDAIR